VAPVFIRIGEKDMTTLVDLSQDIHELTPGIIALRRELHHHPELAFAEVVTTATLAGRMRAFELDDGPLERVRPDMSLNVYVLSMANAGRAVAKKVQYGLYKTR
jgi:metal-dependent amidase/aminoacylase/carboxypeptidase family protein